MCLQIKLQHTEFDFQKWYFYQLICIAMPQNKDSKWLMEFTFLRSLYLTINVRFPF